MRKTKILSALSAAMLASVSAVALAQDAGERKSNAPAAGRDAQPAPVQKQDRSGPAVQQRNEPAGRENTEQRSKAGNEGKAAGSAARDAESKGKADTAGKSENRSEKGAQARDNRDDRQRSEQRQSEDTERAGKAAQRKSADERQNEKATPKAAEGGQPKAERGQVTGKDDGNRAAQRAQEPNARTGSPASGARSGTEGAASAQRDGNRVGAVRLSDQQRTVIRERLVSERRPQSRSRNVNVNVSIGSTVPRGVSLMVLPATIVRDVPEYRGYRYALVDEEIIIVEPRTSRVVEIIERDGSARSARGGGSGPRELQLSSAEQRIVYEAVIRDFDPVDVRVKLGLGASIPRSVELDRFPRRVLVELPQLKDYRFVVVEREVVIVDPRSREIVLVIDA